MERSRISLGGSRRPEILPGQIIEDAIREELQAGEVLDATQAASNRRGFDRREFSLKLTKQGFAEGQDLSLSEPLLEALFEALLEALLHERVVGFFLELKIGVLAVDEVSKAHDHLR